MEGHKHLFSVQYAWKILMNVSHIYINLSSWKPCKSSFGLTKDRIGLERLGNLPKVTQNNKKKTRIIIQLC